MNVLCAASVKTNLAKKTEKSVENKTVLNALFNLKAHPK